jgi:hypothetical protein
MIFIGLHNQLAKVISLVCLGRHGRDKFRGKEGFILLPPFWLDVGGQ